MDRWRGPGREIALGDHHGGDRSDLVTVVDQPRPTKIVHQVDGVEEAAIGVRDVWPSHDGADGLPVDGDAHSSSPVLRNRMSWMLKPQLDMIDSSPGMGRGDGRRSGLPRPVR